MVTISTSFADTLPLPTPRLRFAWWDDVDAAHAHALWGNAQVTCLIGGPWTDAEVDEHLQQQHLLRQKHGVQYYPIFTRGTDAFVGCCGLRPRRAECARDGVIEYEIGFHLLPGYWGQRLAPEAAASVLAHAFGQLGAAAIFAGHHPQNAASRKALLRLGFAFTHEELYAPTNCMHPTYVFERGVPQPSQPLKTTTGFERVPPLEGLRPRRCCGLPPRLGAGLVVVLIMAGSQTASSELTKIGLASLHAPFFMMWVHTSFMVFVLPIALALHACGTGCAAARVRPPSWREELWDGGGAGGRLVTCGLRWRLVLTPPRCCQQSVPPLIALAAGFYVLWVAANYSYASALQFASAGIVTSIFSSCSAFVALFSRVLLGEPMNVAKVMSVGLAVGGVLVLGLARSDGAGTGASPLLGVLLALVASLSAAVYKVLFKWAFPGALSWRRLALFLSLLGLVNVALGTAPCLLMGYSGLEERFWAADPPLSTTTWLVLLGACVLVLVFNTSIAVGIALTTPLFISIGTELTIPATMLVDVLAAGTEYTWLEWLGAALLMASFAVLLTGGEAAAGGSGADADEGELAAGHFDSVNARRGMVSSGQTDRERLETESHDCEQTSEGRSCVGSLCSPVGR